MKYHPEILYAKDHFVRRLGWHLKIKKKNMFRNGQKKDQYVQNVRYLSTERSVRIKRFDRYSIQLSLLYRKCSITEPSSNL